MRDHDTVHDDAPALPVVDEELLTVYRRILERDLLDLAALEREFGPDGARRAIRTLTEARLVRPVPGDGGLAVLRPDVAASTLIRPLESGIREAQQRIGRISGEFDRLMAVYKATMEHRNRQDGLIDAIADPDTARQLVRDRIAGARKEVLVMCGPDPEPARRFEWSPFAANDGVRLCVLHQHAARHHGDVQEQAAAVTAGGGQIRTVEKLWTNLCVIDQEMLLVLHRCGAVLVSQPEVAAAVGVLFEQIWSRAKPFHGESTSRSEGRVLRDDVRRAIIYYLAEGMRDESIARRIGVSVRTCRRHIAEVLEQMGAQSRFQAGYLAAKQGLLDL
ncbi:helix-turn-helix transcriptional regulator [Actinoplanes italicus]|uniref:Regulatory LuxR family protein n=1 Tax=Actinoplanes italicus TaxID=113567 RepID=A0A2T0JUU7_9ACTN|nr:helix-turn-helix domain-containing protein [Actinoplanes italicus]PRX11444.1 regulatory LuxR family protein [Actinoplanes italicus]GIE34029.1 helix-turn-helix transcriptional regulator [Actinoplanes italicus]